MNWSLFHPKLLVQAVKYSIPVLPGYLVVGIAFGLLLVKKGYPWWLSPMMSLVMYAGTGQYIAIGLFASGAAFTEMALVQFVVNARHIAYGFSMLKEFNQAGIFKYYLIFALTDETFALLSSLPDRQATADQSHTPEERNRFMFLVALLDQTYWVLGSVIGAVAGSFIPFNMEGIGFSLTALFVVLLIEQILRVRRAVMFIVSGFIAVMTVFILPVRLSLLTALTLSLLAVQLLDTRVHPMSLKEKPPC